MPALPRGRAAQAAGILLLALALRVWDFGNPVIHVDEQFYLLVGERMHDGLLPYLDIWDRKPVGLFLLYAGIAALPGDGILAYQVVATLFAAATAAGVATGAGWLGASARGRWAAALATLLWTSLLGGRGGQSPVFYNLLVAGAALLTLRLPDLAAGRRNRAILCNGAGACLLAGLAIQIKYLPVVEGAFFGLAHLFFLRRVARLPQMLLAAMLWVLCGLLPTLLALAWYASLGPDALHAFWFANLHSILLRPGYPAHQLAMRLLGITAQLAPLLICAGFAWRWRSRGGAAGERVLLAVGWMLAATIGFFAIGTFFDHYALPLVPPLAMLAGRAFGRSTRAAVASLGLALTLFAVERVVARDAAGGARHVARIVAANSRGGCPYVFIGDTVTYTLSHACLPTRYVFPNFLAYATERGATGIDEAAEVRRILANRPPVIVTSTRELEIWNPDSLAAVEHTLAADYRLVFRTRRRSYHTLVYLRRDLPFRD